MTTVSEREEKAVQEVVPRRTFLGALRRQERTCATSVPPTALTASKAVTQRVHAAGMLLARTTDLLDRPGSLVYAQPPTLARSREKHHEAARKHDNRVLRHLRLIWGYFHLIFQTILHGLVWVTESPWRVLGALVLALIIYFWS